MVEEAAKENGFTFTEKYIDGPHILHLTHPQDVATLLLNHINPEN